MKNTEMQNQSDEILDNPFVYNKYNALYACKTPVDLLTWWE